MTIYFGVFGAYLRRFWAGLLLGIVVSSSVQDGWVCGYAMSVALTLLWSVKNGYPKQEFYVSRTTIAGIWVAFSEECQQ